ncbi:MAG: zinc ribbon domain-containing protein [Candidatus Zixiibacteriota bacterium]
MKCPECKEEIEDGAKKCKHCGSYTEPGKRRYESTKDIVQFATFIAAIIVLFLMLGSNLIMQKSVEQGSEAVELTKVSIAKIDTGFALTREQIRIQQEQLDWQKKSVETLSKGFIEEKRPRLEINTTKIDLQDTSIILYVDFVNKGFADAEDILVYIVLKYMDSPNDTLGYDIDRVSKITKAKPRTWRWGCRLLRRSDLICLIEVRYTWRIVDLNFKENKFYNYVYNQEDEKYGIYTLTGEQIKDLWK